MNDLAGFWSAMTSYCGATIREKESPPSLPKAEDTASATAETLRRYVEFLSDPTFKADTHSVLPLRETKELRGITHNLNQHQATAAISRIGCCAERTRIRSPWREACCSSREGCFAMITGFTIGCLSRQLNLFFTTQPHFAQSLVAGMIAGLASVGTTYFILVDSHKRIEAMTRKRDLHRVFVKFFSHLAKFLIELDEVEKRQPTYDRRVVTFASQQAAKLLAKKGEILSSFSSFYSEKEEAKYEEGRVFDRLFQACAYLTTGDLGNIADHDLRSDKTILENTTTIERILHHLTETQAALNLAHQQMAAQQRALVEMQRVMDQEFGVPLSSDLSFNESTLPLFSPIQRGGSIAEKSRALRPRRVSERKEREVIADTTVIVAVLPPVAAAPPVRSVLPKAVVDRIASPPLAALTGSRLTKILSDKTNRDRSPALAAAAPYRNPHVSLPGIPFSLLVQDVDADHENP